MLLPAVLALAGLAVTSLDGVVSATRTAAVPTGVADRDASRCLPRRHLQVRLTIASGPPSDAETTVRHIVDDTWRSEGLIISWAQGAPDADAWQGLDLWVAIVPGIPAASDGGPMGEVRFHRDQPRRMIRVSLDAVVAWVSRDQAARFGTSTVVRNQTIGRNAELVPRALGYIVAHEIGHVVLGTRAHARSGVMQATYAGAERLLTTPGALGLDATNRAVLRTRLADAARCD